MPLFCLIMPHKLLKKTALFTCVTMMSPAIYAEWNAKFDTNMYYTDDVALFSVTRRLSLKDDPTQPVVDRPNQGGDFVYEPDVELEWSGHNALGALTVGMEAGGYVFANQSDFSHGLYEFNVSQTLATDTKISVDYNFVPDLFLGQNVLRQENSAESEQDEKLTNHFWSLHVDQPVSNDITIRLLGRYGLRHYNAPFQHRDTQFWTVGPHLEWRVHPDIELLVGYHYERGIADHQHTINVSDDISYVNHYASAEIKLRLTERLSSVFIIDYEKNTFTSQYINDEHHDASENLFQGEVELVYTLDNVTNIKLGWQHGNRKVTTESQNIKNNNVWLGVEYFF